MCTNIEDTLAEELKRYPFSYVRHHVQKLRVQGTKELVIAESLKDLGWTASEFNRELAKIILKGNT